MTAGSSGPFPEAPLFPRPVQWALTLCCLVIAILAVYRSYDLSASANRPLDVQPSYPVDLNRATLAELELLPGVGPTLAMRLVEQRQRVGGFRELSELLDIPGIGPGTLEQLQKRVVFSPSSELSIEQPVNVLSPETPSLLEGVKVDPNRASLEELKRLPKIGPILAARIVEARTAQPFKSVDDLRRVRGIGVKTLEEIRPHLRIE